jgi:hypothetical protein
MCHCHAGIGVVIMVIKQDFVVLANNNLQAAGATMLCACRSVQGAALMTAIGVLLELWWLCLWLWLLLCSSECSNCKQTEKRKTYQAVRAPTLGLLNIV